jgi:hypothetical protein
MQVTARGAAGALAAGIASALITRALMRAVALLTNEEPTFHVGGLFVIAAIYVVALLPGCFALARTSAWWAWALLGVGVALLGVQAAAIGLQETSSAHAMTAGHWIGLIITLAAMLATYGAQVVLAVHWARHGFGRHRVKAILR